LGFAVFQTVFVLYAQDRLDLGVRTTGFLLAYVGVLAVAVQAGAIPWLSRRVGEPRLITVNLGVMAAAMLGWALTPNLAALVVVITPLAVSGGILNTVINSAISKAVGPEEIGGSLGLSAALESLSRIVAPIVGAWSLQAVGSWAPGAACALLLAWTTAFAVRKISARPGGTPEAVEPRAFAERPA
jgi:DHA1 family tetracycline resistance protein-like MFS transporter